MTVTVCPATVTVPLRAAPALAAIVSVTVPFPVPLVPEATVINAALPAVIQLHVLGAVTVTVDVPPAAVALITVDDSVYVHTTAGAAS